MNKMKLLSVMMGIAICVSSCGMQKTVSLENDLRIFSDPMANGLKARISKKKINAMQNADLKAAAMAMYNKQYKFDYRLAAYKAYLKPEILGSKLHIGSGYSNYEGVTGVVLKKGEQTILVNGIKNDKKVNIVVPNWERHAPEGTDPTKDPNGWGIHKKVYPLQNGVNVLAIEEDGLAYVDYYSETPEVESKISVHFVNDPVNGYFDVTRNSNAEWDSLLAHSVYPVIDGKGRNIQIVYPVKACQKYAAGKGVELLANYDSMVYLQHQFIGLKKYNKVFDNRILARVNYNYYMFRDGDGVAYMGAQPGYAMSMVVNPESVIKGDPCWGFNHEVGHVHQLRPYLNWGGLGEVSNNIVTLYVTTRFGNRSRLSEQKSYEKARKSIIDGQLSYLEDGDVFNRLVPFWQLQLYFSQNGHSDFYADLYEALRNSAEEMKGLNPWKNVATFQLNFVKQCCKVSKMDLTDFFTKWGFLKPISLEINDYGKYQMDLTQEMVDRCKAEIASWNLPLPPMDITLIED
ncbi:MAG: M60 family metallopeptidase [Odoribacter sp.]